ncbi:uncharacterized protein F54H12.2-like [Macrosteles quadrilineatus]|uniref:uncharacterized protein F54H12.2-like n=1 Tax=Macrosteles quadrilineatus TaxID=74068 RepID=UPI0023E0F1BE|nr:uncharacterized protein F54H12.2-like [Macrosteles quadrilineatus]XP_054257390.1 uncharacterized protein F54H12.2-like [Macrosteles quadrilineatus]XP_054260360.1 uncharacterized protein F54H12.2-like [Macrosteles quadrilineatus]XP_054260377.1 uncharacterized protein F54H12.2-like [Macrosteles quadrilineatus]XP_054260631.1 uncharacterized protein F54H12.2-like [Macrosteles quadrilineatus]XP_054272641.1 uncharacterized protein F54H12.2-like [Macrosteles quadrilineatus]XP_054281726.1 uncharac
MSFIHQKSCECVKTELDLFSLPPTQTSIENGKWIQYKPISSLTDDSPIEFVIPANGEEYTDLTQTLLHVEATIVKGDGTKVEEALVEEIGPVNNWLHSLFSQVDLFVNHKLVSPQNNTYAYRAYLENLLNYGGSAKKSHLTTTLFYEDKADKMDDCDIANDGLVKRRGFVKKSTYVDMVGNLHLDLCNQDKFMLNGVEMRLRLVRSRNSFAVMSKTATDCKVHIREANLFVRRCKINPGVLVAHSKTLESGTAKYPITRVDVKSITLPSGILGKTLDSVFLGQLPKRIIVGLVDNVAFNGDFKKNPFNFQHFNLNYFALYIDGEQVPCKALTPAFTGDSKLYALAYHTLFTGTGIQFADKGNEIDRTEYPNGYCLMAFDLTPDMSAGESSHWNLVRNGNLRIELQFKEALAASVNCIVYAELDNVIEVDRHRNVSVDFSG